MRAADGAAAAGHKDKVGWAGKEGKEVCMCVVDRA